MVKQVGLPLPAWSAQPQVQQQPQALKVPCWMLPVNWLRNYYSVPRQMLPPAVAQLWSERMAQVSAQMAELACGRNAYRGKIPILLWLQAVR
jgi:hypothetical protein